MTIKGIVEGFNQQLFTDNKKSLSVIYKYLAKNNFLKLTEEQKQITNVPLTMMEITEAIFKQ